MSCRGHPTRTRMKRLLVLTTLVVSLSACNPNTPPPTGYNVPGALARQVQSDINAKSASDGHPNTTFSVKCVKSAQTFDCLVTGNHCPVAATNCNSSDFTGHASYVVSEDGTTYVPKAQ